jgi:hypothetical protein
MNIQSTVYINDTIIRNFKAQESSMLLGTDSSYLYLMNNTIDQMQSYGLMITLLNPNELMME